MTDRFAIPSGYTMYGGTLSYFTMKLDAALQWYGVPYELQMRTADNRAELEQRSGTHRIPVLQTPEQWMLWDTTPIMDILDQQMPRRRLFPTGELGVLVHLVEEYFDEWIARTAVHYRWQHDESSRVSAEGIARETAPDADEATQSAFAKMVADWGVRACRATGVSEQHQQRACEQEYERILEALERQLAETRYALGDRMCAVDAVLLGGLRAHFDRDPVPKRLVQRFERVAEWSQRAHRSTADGALAGFPESTPFARFILQEMAATYAPVVAANAAALEQKQKAFSVPVYGQDVSFLTRPYPEQSRRMLQQRIRERLDDAERARVERWLSDAKLDVFAP